MVIDVMINMMATLRVLNQILPSKLNIWIRPVGLWLQWVIDEINQYVSSIN